VRDRVARVRETLPDDIDEPIVSKTEADAEPIMYLAFSSDRHSPLDVTDAADRLVQDRLQTLPGVADVPIYGERRYAMRIWLDPARLAAFRMTTQDVETRCAGENVEVPAGRIESRMREFTVLSETDLHRRPSSSRGRHTRQCRRITWVRLRDVGRAEIGAADDRIVARYNGKSAVALGVVKQSTPTRWKCRTRCAPRCRRSSALLPEGMQIAVAYDSSTFISRSIDESSPPSARRWCW
jgi:multidrug efflux pump